MITTLKQLIIDLFGSYTPITYQIEDSSGNLLEVIPSGSAGVDWTWIAGVLLFALTFYCIMRIVGGILTNVTSR